MEGRSGANQIVTKVYAPYSNHDPCLAISRFEWMAEAALVYGIINSAVQIVFLAALTTSFARMPGLGSAP